MNRMHESNSYSDEKEPQVCALGDELGDCTMRRVAGCTRLYDVLLYLHPPAAVIERLRALRDENEQVDAYLDRIESIAPPIRTEHMAAAAEWAERRYGPAKAKAAP